MLAPNETIEPFLSINYHGVLPVFGLLLNPFGVRVYRCIVVPALHTGLFTFNHFGIVSPH
jgi:hypothetical protein